MSGWTPEVDAIIIRLRSAEVPFTAIAKELGTGYTKDMVQKRHKKLSGEVGVEVDAESVVKTLGLFPEWPGPRPSPTVTNGSRLTYAITAGDFHFGEETYDPIAEEILLQVAEDLRPTLYVANGDVPDLLAVSRYPRDVRTKGKLEVEIGLTKAHYKTMRETLPQGARIVETNANHSGEGIESRWWRYLSAMIPQIMDSETVASALSYASIFHDPRYGVEIVDHVEVAPGLIALHGDIVRSHSSYSAKAMLEKWRVNLIHNHTHRLGYYGYRVPAIGQKREHQMRAYEGGCMCKLTAPYLSVANWQQGFCVISSSESGFSVEQVLIHDGRAVVATTGKEYVA